MNLTESRTFRQTFAQPRAELPWWNRYGQWILFGVFFVAYEVAAAKIPLTPRFATFPDWSPYLRNTLHLMHFEAPEMFWPFGYSLFLGPFLGPASQNYELNLRGLLIFQSISIPCCIASVGYAIRSSMPLSWSNSSKLIFSAVFYTFFVFYESSYLYAHNVGIDTGYLIMSCAAIFCFVKLLETEQVRWAVGLCVTSIVAYYIRHIIMPVLFVWLLGFYFLHRTQRRFRIAAATFVLFALAAPFVIGLINLHEFGRFHASFLTGWFDLAEYNSDKAGGYFYDPENTYSHDTFLQGFQYATADVAGFEQFNDFEKAEVFKSWAVPWIKSHPKKYAVLCVKRLYNVMLSTNNNDASRPLKELIQYRTVSFIELRYYVLALLIVFALVHGKRSWPLAVFIGMHLLFFAAIFSRPRHRWGFEYALIGVCLYAMVDLARAAWNVVRRSEKPTFARVGAVVFAALAVGGIRLWADPLHKFQRMLRATEFQEIPHAVTNGSFEDALADWTSPGNCSGTERPDDLGSTVTIVSDASDGKSAVQLSAVKHILCMASVVKNLEPNHLYELTYRTKTIQGTEPVVYLDGASGGLTQRKGRDSDLENGWKQKQVFFVTLADDNYVTIHIYADAKPDGYTTVLYDKFTISKAVY